MALGEEDRQWLERSAGRAAVGLEKWWIGSAVFLFLCALVNLGLAAWLGQESLPGILKLWVSGVQADRSYPGFTVKALERVTVAVLQLGGVLYLCVHVATKRRERARYASILAAALAHSPHAEEGD